MSFFASTLLLLQNAGHIEHSHDFAKKIIIAERSYNNNNNNYDITFLERLMQPNDV